MRADFPGFYRPSSAEFQTLWQQCEFVFDANVLLHIYRYGDEARQHLLSLLGRIKDRVWIPYQVAFEFQRRRPDVVWQQLAAYDQLIKGLEETRGSVRTMLDPFRRRHALIEAAWIEKTIEQAVRKIQRKLRQQKASHPNLLHDDALRDELDILFSGRVGPRPNKQRQQEFIKLADERLKAGIPPGLRDTKKDDAGHGDVLVWIQLLERARDQKQPIIFVTDDAKDDWWLVHHGQTLGPRPELVEEIRSEAGIAFYMYATDRFIEEAERFFSVSPQPDVVEEVREVQRADQSEAAKRLATLERQLAQMRDLRAAAVSDRDLRTAFEDAFAFRAPDNVRSAWDAIMRETSATRAAREALMLDLDVSRATREAFAASRSFREALERPSGFGDVRRMLDLPESAAAYQQLLKAYSDARGQSKVDQNEDAEAAQSGDAQDEVPDDQTETE